MPKFPPNTNYKMRHKNSAFPFKSSPTKFATGLPGFTPKSTALEGHTHTTDEIKPVDGGNEVTTSNVDQPTTGLGTLVGGGRSRSWRMDVGRRTVPGQL